MTRAPQGPPPVLMSLLPRAVGVVSLTWLCAAPGPLSVPRMDTVELDAAEITSNLHLTPDRLEVKNDSWSFESARANLGVRPGRRWSVMWALGDHRVEHTTLSAVPSSCILFYFARCPDQCRCASRGAVPRDTLTHLPGTLSRYYEVTILGTGIAQIGWCSADCWLDPINGHGVGDDTHSYAFDGNRQRAWHGLSSELEYV